MSGSDYFSAFTGEDEYDPSDDNGQYYREDKEYRGRNRERLPPARDHHAFERRHRYLEEPIPSIGWPVHQPIPQSHPQSNDPYIYTRPRVPLAQPSLPPAQPPRSRIWDQLEHLEFGVDQQHGKALVPRKPWVSNNAEPSTPFNRKVVEPYAPETAVPFPVSDHRRDDEGMRRQRSPDKPPLAKNKENIAMVQDHPSVSSRSFDSNAPIRQVDLVYDPSQASKDMSIRLELDVEEDWEADLEDFCRLRRLGRFKQAKEYFRSKLERVSSIPYIRVQYAEMLEACGDYKSLQNLVFRREFAPNPSEESLDDRNRGKLAANDALLECLSQRPSPTYVQTAWRVVHNTLQGLATETTMGSTEFQLLSLCLRVLYYIERCTHEHVVGPIKVYIKCLFDWRQLYNELVGDSCIWDFRDLFVAAVSVFGWQETSALLLGTSYFPQALDVIIKDWDYPFYDEASTIGLLDLFTSLILQDTSDNMKAYNSLLLQHARALAESVQSNDPEHMRCRPFVQWLLARSLLELEASPEHPHEHSSGARELKVDQGRGVHLPIYVPSRHGRKPDWNLASFRSSAMQRGVIEVAIRVASEIGDYTSQATALKLLILRSQDPKTSIDALTHLQLETQGDRDGYLATCLSRYLVATSRDEEIQLLRELEKPGGPSNAMYFEQCPNATLKWAREVIRDLLSSPRGGTGSSKPSDRGPSLFSGRKIELDGSELPPYIAEFTRAELGISVSPSFVPLKLEHANEPGNNMQHTENGKQQESLRNRFVRRATSPEPDPGQKNPSNLNAFDTGMYNPPAAGYPLCPPGGIPPPPRPAATVQRQAPDPFSFYSGEQPDPLLHGIRPSVEVSGWGPTWYEDAKRCDGRHATPQHRQNAGQGQAKNQAQEHKAGEVHSQRGDRNDRACHHERHRKVEKEASQDQRKASGNRNRTHQGQDEPGTGQNAASDDQPKNKASNSRGRRAKILDELESLDDLYENPDTEQARAGSAGEKPQISIEDGVTKLNFPSNILDGHGMTLLLTDRENPHKLKAYIVEKGGIFETIASGRIHRRGDGEASNDTKSEFNIRTNSVNFDVPSSSDESAELDEVDWDGTAVVKNKAADHTSRRRASQGKGRKGKNEVPSTPPRAGEEQKMQGNADAQAQQPARDKSEQPATNHPQGSFVFNNAEASKTKEPEPMMSGAVDGGEQPCHGDSVESTKRDGAASIRDPIGEGTKGKENETESFNQPDDGIPPLPPSPPPMDRVAPPRLAEGRTSSYDGPIEIELLQRRTHKGTHGIRLPSSPHAIHTGTRKERDLRPSTSTYAQPEELDPIIAANPSRTAHRPPTTERGGSDEIETCEVIE